MFERDRAPSGVRFLEAWRQIEEDDQFRARPLRRWEPDAVTSMERDTARAWMLQALQAGVDTATLRACTSA
jgi:glucuronate isomerase